VIRPIGAGQDVVAVGSREIRHDAFSLSKVGLGGLQVGKNPAVR
jgi:hypothetical protein